MPVTMSVTDTSPIVDGSTAACALNNTIDLAVACDRLGYHRFWIAEHHGMRGVASAVPSITIASAATRTKSLRFGAGGVILPNHPPLHVAEQYGMLGALVGSVDLAVGRSLGGTEATVNELRPTEQRTAKLFDEQISELESYFERREPGGARAIPAEGMRPAIWVLGSTTRSAEIAARRGLPYAFAHHLAPDNAASALATYRNNFEPSTHLTAPKCLVSVTVIAGEDDDHARWLAGSTQLKVVSRSHKKPINLPSPEAAAAYEYTRDDRELIAQSSASVFSGGVTTVRERLGELCNELVVDELMVASPIFRHRDRLRSYELAYEATRAS